MNNYKLGKNPKHILNQLIETRSKPIPKEIKLLKHQIRHRISQILDFDQANQNYEQLITLSRETKLNKKQLLDLWSQSMMEELKKFIFKLNTISTLNKSTPSDKIGKEILIKLEKCSTSINGIISIIAQRQNWCLCNRRECQGRFDTHFTHQRIKDFVLSNLKIQVQSPTEQYLQNLSIGCLSFFNVQNDFDCNILTLENLSNGKSKKQNCIIKLPQNNQVVLQYLKHLEIEHSSRKDCYINTQWIQQLRQKNNKMFQF